MSERVRVSFFFDFPIHKSIQLHYAGQHSRRVSRVSPILPVFLKIKAHLRLLGFERNYNILIGLRSLDAEQIHGVLLHVRNRAKNHAVQPTRFFSTAKRLTERQSTVRVCVNFLPPR